MKTLLLILIITAFNFNSPGQTCNKGSKVNQIMIVIKGVKTNPKSVWINVFQDTLAAFQKENSNAYTCPLDTPIKITKAVVTPPKIENYSALANSSIFSVQKVDNICTAIFEFTYKEKFDLEISYPTNKINVDNQVYNKQPFKIQNIDCNKKLQIFTYYYSDWEYFFEYQPKQEDVNNPIIHYEVKIKECILNNPRSMLTQKERIYVEKNLKNLQPIKYHLVNCSSCDK